MAPFQNSNASYLCWSIGVPGKKVNPPYVSPSWSDIVLNHKTAEVRGLLLSSPLPNVVNHLVHGKCSK